MNVLNFVLTPFKAVIKVSAVESVNKTATYGGASAAVYFGLTLNELGVIVGMIIGIAGFIAGQYWKWREAVWREREAEAKEANRWLPF